MSNKVVVVLINGTTGSGKDSFIGYCIAHKGENADVGVTSTSIIDYDKNILYKYYNWNGVKTPEVRKLLSYMQNLGMESHIQTKHITRIVNEVYDSMDKPTIIFVQARRDSHLEEIKSLIEVNSDVTDRNIKVRSLYVYRPNSDSDPNVTEQDAEAANSKYVYDDTIINDAGLNLLQMKAEQYIDRIIEEEIS